ncbi:hypothetical protein KCP73_14435 [Salmonella enterica subsp. enterica]|nr:hypothetical protein KCP73_14435 [Salmonella enterica subsp. enterica]
MAVIAGLPKRFLILTPLYPGWTAVARRNVALSRISQARELHHPGVVRLCPQRPMTQNYHAPEIALRALICLEMRAVKCINRYGESAYEDGYRI